MRVTTLLNWPAQSDAQRWQLVSSLYDQVRSLIEGSVALLLTLAVCAAYTGWWGFAALAGTTAALTLVRLFHWRAFVQARRGGGCGARSPEAWARDYTIGICAMAALWALTVCGATFAVRDMQLLLFVLLIQNAWLAGAGIRNAASPAAILGQTLVAVVPTIVCTLFGTGSLVRLLAPACSVFVLVLLKIARFYATQLLSLMESEQRLAAANEKLLKLSCTDGLTGIANRRAFDERLVSDWAFAVREARDIAVVVVDVDYFKRYNDHYGHLAGDDCLRVIAAAVARAVSRASDFPARYGGEEFVVLLPGNGNQGATEVAERLQRAVYDAMLPHDVSPLGRVTISAGVASMAPGLSDLPAKLMTLADKALYQAKRSGRNRVCVAAPAQPCLGGAGISADESLLF
jgi:diguanylate cyclase (GGDEF)-like protein